MVVAVTREMLHDPTALDVHLPDGKWIMRAPIRTIWLTLNLDFGAVARMYREVFIGNGVCVLHFSRPFTVEWKELHVKKAPA